MAIFKDVLDNLREDTLRVTPPMDELRRRTATPAALSSSPPTNQQILDATKAFYASNQDLVDTNTQNTNSGATDSSFVSTMNSYDWKNQSLTQDEQGSTSNGIFGQSGSGGGIWGPTLNKVNASDLYTTIGVGINANAQFIVGGGGGLGCAWDIAKREGPRGYGYVLGEIGLDVNFSINVQCLVLNQLPSQLDQEVFGLAANADYGVGVCFQTFFDSNLKILGFGIGAGVGLGFGATVFGGKIWNFT